MAAGPPADALLSAGRVGRPHGLDGSFHVTRPRPRLLVDGGTVVVGDRQLTIVRRSGTDARPILRLSGHGHRDDVEALRGAELWVRRADAPPLEEDEWFAEDLEGCLVVDGEREVGVVQRLLPYPSCDLLDVRRAGSGASLLVPLISDAVRQVDVEAGRIDVDLSFLGEAE
ncbi:MAG TPA: ribosome maturation factor RimM [Baekduia sp.]|nr:ribosome maturation factor RimM [Baekduia sp.]